MKLILVFVLCALGGKVVAEISDLPGLNGQLHLPQAVDRNIILSVSHQISRIETKNDGALSESPSTTEVTRTTTEVTSETTEDSTVTFEETSGTTDITTDDTTEETSTDYTTEAPEITSDPSSSSTTPEGIGFSPTTPSFGSEFEQFFKKPVGYITASVTGGLILIALGGSVGYLHWKRKGLIDSGKLRLVENEI